MKSHYHEEIAKTGSITVWRRLNTKLMNQHTPEEEAAMLEEYGRPISEVYEFLLENATHVTQDGSVGLESRIRRCTQFYSGVSENLKAMNDYLPTVLTNVYKKLDVLLLECDDEIENVAILDKYKDCRIEMTMLICQQIQFITNVREKMDRFFMDNPYRVLQMATPRILTIDNCLTPTFLPYVLGEKALPNWVVPHSVRILNGARKIIQMREYIERKSVELRHLLMKSVLMCCLSECIISQIAVYAVDVSQIEFDLFPVVTEEMLLRTPKLHIYRQHDFMSRNPRVILTI